ncbi:MAG: enolase C-terminal domain-like protein [Isosphaeraceae bacterium]|nr:enolase C-terminal domain-like protein [Isosphaeraceae bacterium]
MRIESVEAIPVRIPLLPERRMVSAIGRQDVSEFALVRIRTEDGLEGVGEATVTPRWSGETVWGAAAIVDRLFAPRLIGRDPRDVDGLERLLDSLTVGNPFAKSAIETACWDLAGRAAGVPVHVLLGGPCRPPTIRNRFSLGAYPADVAAERAADLVSRGFDTIKVKVGTDPERDIARVRAVREAIGDSVSLTIDANGGWSEPEAMRCLRALESCEIAWVEQPLPRGRYSAARRLRDALGVRILADEDCFEESDACELIEQCCCDALSIYPGKNGGIARARRIAELAASAGIPCTIGSNLEWDVGAAAMLQLIAATPNLRIEEIPGDCLGPIYHELRIVRRPIEIAGPLATLPEGPGLGVEVDWDLVERCRLRF